MTTLDDRPAQDRGHAPRGWPTLEPVPASARTTVSARIARTLFTTAVSRLAVSVHLGSRTLGRGGPAMTVHRPEEFFARLGRDGLIGFGEAYLTGAWDAPDLGGFLTVLAAELPRLVPAPLQRLRAAYVRKQPLTHRNTTGNTRGNIAHHYDLSNELFGTFLDPTFSYSSALFTDPADRSESLEEAQGRKIERLLDATGVTAGTRLLEIGSGWGELAIRAARRGAQVTTITLSAEQQSLARHRIAEAGSSDRVQVELLDYRLVDGHARFDAICSVEMIEAVGHEYWTDYFRTLDRLVVPGGRVGIQAITMPHDRMLATRDTFTWINKYIFPGGFLPSVEVMDQITRGHTALRLRERLAFGPHYAETLRRWDEAFLAAGDTVRALGFDDTFVRMWHFYLDYSRAGFASGYLDVNQLVWAKEGR